MVSIPESSALTLRLLDDDDDEGEALDSDSNTGVAREDVLLLGMTAESQSFTSFFLWARVIFNQWLSGVARYPE